MLLFCNWDQNQNGIFVYKKLLEMYVESFRYDEKKDKRRENKYLPLSEFQASAQLQNCEKTENFETALHVIVVYQSYQRVLSFTLVYKN